MDTVNVRIPRSKTADDQACYYLVGGWTNPFEKICASQIGSFPQFSGWKLKIFELPPPSYSTSMLSTWKCFVIVSTTRFLAPCFRCPSRLCTDTCIPQIYKEFMMYIYSGKQAHTQNIHNILIHITIVNNSSWVYFKSSQLTCFLNSFTAIVNRRWGIRLESKSPFFPYSWFNGKFPFACKRNVMVLVRTTPVFHQNNDPGREPKRGAWTAITGTTFDCKPSFV